VINTRPWAALADLRRDRFRVRSWVVPSLASAEEGPVLAPIHPVEVEHWPEEAAPTAARDDSDLAGRLAERPLPEDLRDRLAEWLQSGGDTALEEALAALGENAMQTAFNLLYAP
jgi:hypothetical protein